MDEDLGSVGRAAAEATGQRTWLLRAVDLLIPGLYAWVMTVGWPAFVHCSMRGVHLQALGALSALLAGACLAARWSQVARVLGVFLFLAFCVAVWVSAPSAMASVRSDPIVGVLGALGWGLYAVAWANDGRTGWGRTPAVRGERPGPARSQRPAGAQPGRAARWASWPLWIALGVAVLFSYLSWCVGGRNRALLAHVVALVASVGLTNVAVLGAAFWMQDVPQASSATGRAPSRQPTKQGGPSLSRALAVARTPLLLLLGLLALAVVRRLKLM